MLFRQQLEQSSPLNHHIHQQRQVVEVREVQRQLLLAVLHLFHLASLVAEPQPGQGQRGYPAVRKKNS
jgi:hypothetical protein